MNEHLQRAAMGFNASAKPLVTVWIENIDSTYQGVFHADSADEAAKAAVEALVAGDHGFFKGNHAINHKYPTQHSSQLIPDSIWGMMLMPGEPAEWDILDEKMVHESTFLIYIVPFEIGKMTCTSG